MDCTRVVDDRIACVHSLGEIMLGELSRVWRGNNRHCFEFEPNDACIICWVMLWWYKMVSFVKDIGWIVSNTHKWGLLKCILFPYQSLEKLILFKWFL